MLRRLPWLAVAVVLLIQGIAVASAAGGNTASTTFATPAATKLCNVKTQLPNGRVVTVYKTKVIKVKIKGKTVKKRVPLTKIVTVKKRVFVYKTVIKKVKGKKKKVKVKVPKLGPCKKKKNSSTTGVPVLITLTDASVAHIDFGGFQRDFPLSGQLKGFIQGKGFVLGQDNQIQLTSGKILLAPTGVFIDDVCNGQVSDAIRTDEDSFVELDQGTTGNTITVAPDSKVTGLLHTRVQTALDLRNDDNGCNNPYITTGWTDFQLPLFIKGKLGATKEGLTTTITTGETVLDELSACLAPGPPDLACNGFAIPFPGILTSDITTIVKVG